MVEVMVVVYYFIGFPDVGIVDVDFASITVDR
jgi:hypothetical protein